MRCRQIRLVFKLGTDVLHARQLVQERLKLAIPNLPLSAGMPVMLQPLSSTSRVMKIGLSSKTMSQMDLSMIAYWTIKFRLMRVAGVANVPIWGDRIKSLQVQVDPDLMRLHGVSLEHGHGDDLGSARFRALEAHAGGQDAHRRHDRYAQSAARRSSTSRRWSIPRTWRSCPIKSDATARRSAWATSPRSSGTPGR